VVKTASGGASQCLIVAKYYADQSQEKKIFAASYTLGEEKK
jgi:hypothetical protein